MTARWRPADVPPTLSQATGHARAVEVADLPAKLRPPAQRPRAVERSALLDTLRSIREPLVLVRAPAGTGKTTAIRQWTEAERRPVAWVRLDASDDDPVVLLTYVARALGTILPIPEELHSALGLSVPPMRERILPLLTEAMVQAPPFVLVLDDAHLLTSDKCWDAVAAVLEGLPSEAQLVLVMRSEPPLPLPRLRVAGAAADIGVGQLALDRAELGELARQHGCVIDDAAVDALLTATEGWVAGVHLACLAAAGRPLREWLPEVRGDRREIAAYLSSEVLEQQPPEVQEFLLRTSVLDELTPSLCELVTCRHDAGRLLRAVSRADLFVVPRGDDGLHFRYHRLFAELLEDELELRHPGERLELHRRVAGWYGAHGDDDAQIRHLLAADAVEEAGAVVAAAWPAAWSRGQSETVRRWLDAFTDSQILRQPALTLTAGWVFTALDDVKRGERWGRAACSARIDDGPSPYGATSLRASQALLRATIAPDGVHRMREDAELAADLESRPGTSWHVDAQLTLGVARWLSGSGSRAVHPLMVAERDGAVHNPSAQLAASGVLSLVAADDGDWGAAREHEAAAATRLAELGFGTHRRCLPMLLARARLQAREQGAGVAATIAAVEDLLARMVPHPWMALAAHVVLGEVALEASLPEAAAAHATAAAALLARYPDAGILRRRAEHLRGAVELTRVAEPLTPAERRVLELLPTHLSEAQIAEQLFVSRNTVKTHLKGLYRKLEASSRADAVQRARDVGLLPRA